MKYTKFEELPVWKAAILLSNRTFKMCADRSFDYQGDLRSQLSRDALSVSNNIAEGFELNTTKDLLKYLYIARGSNGEVRSMLYVLDGDERYMHLASQRAELRDLVTSIGQQLKGWIDSLETKIGRRVRIRI